MSASIEVTPGAAPKVVVGRQDEPIRITRAEDMLYGPFAPMVRLLGEATEKTQVAARLMAALVDEGLSMPVSIEEEQRREARAADESIPCTCARSERSRDSSGCERHSLGWAAAERLFGVSAHALDVVAEAQRQTAQEGMDWITKLRLAAEEHRAAFEQQGPSGSARGGVQISAVGVNEEYRVSGGSHSR